METIKDVLKSFRESRIAGEKKLAKGEITWDEFVFVMLGFEEKLRILGDQL
jgi:hypothetical protein